MVGLGSNILGNILAAVVIAAIGWLLSILLRLPFVLHRRKKLLKFFGITKDHHEMIVYFSTLFVRPGGSEDFQGTPRSFTGPAVPASEFEMVELVAKLFDDPLLDSLPLSIRKWLGRRAPSFRTISPAFAASPSDSSHVKLEGTSILVVGSQYYNSAGHLVIETYNPILKMEQRGPRMIIRVTQGPREEDVFETRQGRDDDLAIVEKLCDHAIKSTVFIAAGRGVEGTKGAVYYIVKNWEKLVESFGTQPFAICLRFQNLRTDPSAFKRPVELFRFPER